MAVKLVKVTTSDDASRAFVTVGSDLKDLPAQIEELQAAGARHFALAEAVKAGIKGTPGISRTTEGCYPVNSKGQSIYDLKDDAGNPLPPAHPFMQPVGYQSTFEVTAKT